MSQVKVVHEKTWYVVTMSEDQALVIVALLGALEMNDVTGGLFDDLLKAVDPSRLSKLKLVHVRDDKNDWTVGPSYILGDAS